MDDLVSVWDGFSPLHASRIPFWFPRIRGVQTLLSPRRAGSPPRAEREHSGVRNAPALNLFFPASSMKRRGVFFFPDGRALVRRANLSPQSPRPLRPADCMPSPREGLDVSLFSPV